MNVRSAVLLAAAVAALPFAAPAAAQSTAGEIALVTGRGTATALDGGVRALAKGDPIYSGEIINSGHSSYVNMKFSDGGYVLLRPNSRFQIEDYAFPGTAAAAAAPRPGVAAPPPPPSASTSSAGTSTRAFFSLLKGGLRAVTGLIGKTNRDDFKMTTPVATIGIRGTDITVIDCDLACQTDPVIFDALQALPPGTSALGASILMVNFGTASITNTATGQTTVVPTGGVALSLASGMQIVLDRMPEFIKNDPPPPPNQCGS